ncbi:MAG: reverse transcriptase/maturase family protein [Candidatus Nomurabacteria bacterium]|jgi:hypothetical protein|nr:reverse transcriptase/maturase family protein [Candidatus Nomurabacteria bacterium]
MGSYGKLQDLMNYEKEFGLWLEKESVAELSRANKPHGKNFVGERPYPHFDNKIGIKQLQNKKNKLRQEIIDSDKLAQHSFWPLIRRDQLKRQYKKGDDKKKESKMKNRPIMFASHHDSCIYAFFASLLREKYESRILNTSLNDSVIGYRRIPISQNLQTNKSNIDFANEIFRTIKTRDNFAVICLDIKGFFDSMNHRKIRDSICDILDVGELPKSFKIVLCVIMKYRYISYSRKLNKIISSRKVSDSLHEAIGKNEIAILKNKYARGIPQGSPISDILANIYLYNFDKKMTEKISAWGGALYRRYSDDILLLVPLNKAKEIYEYARAEIEKEKVKIGKDKTEIYKISLADNKIFDITSQYESGYKKNRKRIQYLGFEFDLQNIIERPGTVEKNYRRAKKITKSMEYKATNAKNLGKKLQKSDKPNLFAYQGLSSKKHRNAGFNKQYDKIKKKSLKITKSKRKEVL